MVWFLIGLGIPVLLIFGFVGLIQLLGKNENKSNSESNSSSGIAYMSPEEMLSHARDIASMPTTPESKPASVTKRAVIGGILGGTPGAIIGAASAIDKNNNSK